MASSTRLVCLLYFALPILRAALQLTGRPEEAWLLTDFTPSVRKIQTPTFAVTHVVRVV